MVTMAGIISVESTTRNSAFDSLTWNRENA